MLKSASWVFLFLLLLPTISYGGFTCLSCRETVVPKDCETIERCGDSEECFSDTYATALGYIRFDLGCRDSQQCLGGSSSGKRYSSSDRLLKSACCHGQLCNVAGGTISGYTTPRGPICFHCSTQAHYNSCNRIKVCGINEKCVIHTKIGHNGLMETGCERETVCNAGSVVGKRDSIRFGRDATCAECCDTDLCNDKCLKQGISVSPCATQPCINGQCHEKGTAYVCQCDKGYGGSHCENHNLADQCLSNPCAFGTCQNYGSYYACTCDSGYTGVNCDISHHDACRTTPCVHGTCSIQGSTYTCKCNIGYIGADCDQAVAVDHCLSNPCANGTCSNSPNGFNCSCDTRYSGPTCDLLKIDDPCVPNPCVHGACARNSTSTATFHCLCHGEYTGQLCNKGCPGFPSTCHGGAVCVVLDEHYCKVCRSDCINGS